MVNKPLTNTCLFSLAVLSLLSFEKVNAQNKVVKIKWDNVITISRTTPTLQVVTNPMLQRNSPIHKGSFDALKNLNADYIRYVPWFPYPRMAVAELKPPTKTETFWDFSHMDSVFVDFMNATKGHPVVINYSTIPVWMFKLDKPVEIPEDPAQVFWNYNPGLELRDTTMKEVADYFVRLFSWYTKGGFTDELGKFHKSGHFYKIPYWEVLNEPDLEHKISPRVYTKIYDAVVKGLKKVSPETKFVGISVALVSNPEWFEYFLHPANHQQGVPLEGISYHFYGRPSFYGQSLDAYQYSFFEQAAGFIDKVRYIENIRKRLAPQVFTHINEIGNIMENRDYKGPIPAEYWNLSGAMYAHMFVELTKLGIEVAGESQLVGFPTQFPDVSMMNWINGKPNARYWVLKLVKDNFGPGDQLVTTTCNTPDVSAQAFSTKNGRNLLLINKRNSEIKLDLPEVFSGAEINTADSSTGENPAAVDVLSGRTITLKAFAVTVVKLKK